MEQQQGSKNTSGRATKGLLTIGKTRLRIQAEQLFPGLRNLDKVTMVLFLQAWMDINTVYSINRNGDDANQTEKA